MFVSIAFVYSVAAFLRTYSVLKLIMLMVVMLYLVSFPPFKAQKRFIVQHCTEEDWKVWSVKIFEKLTSSLNVHVDQ